MCCATSRLHCRNVQVLRECHCAAALAPWFQYLLDHWLCDRWFTAVSGQFRALLPRLFQNTTNSAEVTWRVLKIEYLRGIRANDFGFVLRRVLGSPLPELTYANLVMQRVKTIDDIERGTSKRPTNAGRDRMAANLLPMVALARDNDTFVAPEGGPAGALMGHVVVGAAHAGMSLSYEDASGAPEVKATGVKDLNAGKGYYGGRGDGVPAAKAAARAAAAAPLPVRPPSRAGTSLFPEGTAGALAQVVWDVARSPPAADFGVMQRQSTTQAAQLYAACAALHPDTAAALLALPGPAADSVPPLAYNQAVANALRQGWTALTPQDWRGDASAPAVAYIYAVLVTMTVGAWRAEYDRVVVRGAARSRLHGTPIPFGYRAVCSEVHSVLAAAGAISDTALLTAVYIGQEERSSSSTRFCRVWEHGTAAGNDNIMQLVHINHRSTGTLREAHAGIVVERRIIAILPVGSRAVDVAEAAVLLALLRSYAGVVCLNNSPPGEPDGVRFLHASHTGAEPKVLVLGRATKENTAAVARRLPTDMGGYFMQRALVAVSRMMPHHQQVDGTPTPPALALESGSTAYSWLQCYDALDTLLQSGGRATPHHVQLWCDSCDCMYRELVCKHILVARLHHLTHGGAVLWSDRELELFRQGAVPVPTLPPTPPLIPVGGAGACAVNPVFNVPWECVEAMMAELRIHDPAAHAALATTMASAAYPTLAALDLVTTEVVGKRTRRGRVLQTRGAGTAAQQAADHAAAHPVAPPPAYQLQATLRAATQTMRILRGSAGAAEDVEGVDMFGGGDSDGDDGDGGGQLNLLDLFGAANTNVAASPARPAAAAAAAGTAAAATAGAAGAAAAAAGAAGSVAKRQRVGDDDSDGVYVGATGALSSLISAGTGALRAVMGAFRPAGTGAAHAPWSLAGDGHDEASL